MPLKLGENVPVETFVTPPNTKMQFSHQTVSDYYYGLIYIVKDDV